MDVRKWIRNNRILIFDGGMGTYYAEKTGRFNVRCEDANIEAPEVVEEIHDQYIEAGCNAIKTNTFGVNAGNLGGNEEWSEALLSAGYDIAVRAAGDARENKGREVFVFADIGPVSNVPHADTRRDYDEIDALEECCGIIDVFLKKGAENFLFETLSSDEYIFDAVRYLKKKSPEAYVIISFAVQPDGYTREGIPGSDALRRAYEDENVDCCGVNCVSGAHHLLQFVKTLGFRDGRKPFSFMPNAGYPTVIDNRTFYGNTPSYFAEKMAEAVENGIDIIGGCCGTTPEYIGSMFRELASRDLLKGKIVSDASAEADSQLKEEKTPGGRKIRRKNRFAEKLLAGERVIAVELDPPPDANIDTFMDCAGRLKRSGADIITIADCPVAHARVDSGLLACKVMREVGIQTLPHMTCRDRNINATKAMLMGMNIEGINNVLVVTGDPIPTAEKDEVKSVFNFNSRMLINFISRLNESLFVDDPYNVCGALNINALNFEHQLRHAEKKQESGVNAFLTQPVLSKQGLKNLRIAKKRLKGKILCGIMPVVSYRNAQFMNSEISGIKIDDDIIEKYKDKDREQCAKLAVQISLRFMKSAEAYSDGFYLITPFRRVEIIEEILEKYGRDR